MIDDPSTTTPQPSPHQDVNGGRDKTQTPGKPQEATKDPQSTGPKWPGGGKKGENEK